MQQLQLCTMQVLVGGGTTSAGGPAAAGGYSYAAAAGTAAATSSDGTGQAVAAPPAGDNHAGSISSWEREHVFLYKLVPGAVAASYGVSLDSKRMDDCRCGIVPGAAARRSPRGAYQGPATQKRRSSLHDASTTCDAFGLLRAPAFTRQTCLQPTLMRVCQDRHMRYRTSIWASSVVCLPPHPPDALLPLSCSCTVPACVVWRSLC